MIEKICIFLLSAGCFVSFTILDTYAGFNSFLKVYFLDVGQGDSIFIEANGNQMLVDGGPDATVLQRLGEVMPPNDRTIDVVVLTHPDADHLAGLIDVLKNYEVSYIVETGMECPTSVCRVWEQVAAEEGAERIFIHQGDRIELRDGIYADVLYPMGSMQNLSVKDRNNYGIVMKVVYGAQSLLLTADIEKKAEDAIVASNIDIDSDFLKVGHHGSKTSTSEALLDKVTPQAAFIGVGRSNRYGHPHPLVTDRLDRHGIPYYRTDSDGTIELLLDGENYQVNTLR